MTTQNFVDKFHKHTQTPIERFNQTRWQIKGSGFTPS